jgi:hypothetical protein
MICGTHSGRACMLIDACSIEVLRGRPSREFPTGPEALAEILEVCNTSINQCWLWRGCLCDCRSHGCVRDSQRTSCTMLLRVCKGACRPLERDQNSQDKAPPGPANPHCQRSTAHTLQTKKKSQSLCAALTARFTPSGAPASTLQAKQVCRLQFRIHAVHAHEK